MEKNLVILKQIFVRAHKRAIPSLKVLQATAKVRWMFYDMFVSAKKSESIAQSRHRRSESSSVGRFEGKRNLEAYVTSDTHSTLYGTLHCTRIRFSAPHSLVWCQRMQWRSFLWLLFFLFYSSPDAHRTSMYMKDFHCIAALAIISFGYIDS